MLAARLVVWRHGSSTTSSSGPYSSMQIAHSESPTHVSAPPPPSVAPWRVASRRTMEPCSFRGIYFFKQYLMKPFSPSDTVMISLAGLCPQAFMRYP